MMPAEEANNALLLIPDVPKDDLLLVIEMRLIIAYQRYSCPNCSHSFAQRIHL
jgi:hypothetical protein